MKAESDDSIQLSPAEEKELWEAMEEIRRGEYVDGEDLLSELRSRDLHKGEVDCPDLPFEETARLRCTRKGRR